MPRSITINYDLEYKSNLRVEVDQFDGMTPDQIEQELQSVAEESAKANMSVYVQNMSALVAEIVEGLKALEAEREEEEV